jgi:hypothetical protein
MNYRRLVSFFATLLVAVVTSATVGFGAASTEREQSDRKHANVTAPLNIAILMQDDLISQVGNELKVTRDFIRALPQGSRVMVGYVTAGTLQVRQPFTTDLDMAARSLRIPRSSTSGSPFNPYVEVIDALQRFDGSWKGRNVVLLISDGLDTSRGFDVSASGDTLDLQRAITEANNRNVTVYTFYAPSVGLTSRSRLAASYGQSSLNRLADATGGKAFFQGTTGFVTFDSYFQRLRQMLNEAYARAF